MPSICVISCSGEKKDQKSINEKHMNFPWMTWNYFLKGCYGNYFENWRKQDSGIYYGLGYFLDSENEDTLFRQRMKLLQNPEGIFMYFDFKNQNDKRKVNSN